MIKTFKKVGLALLFTMLILILIVIAFEFYEILLEKITIAQGELIIGALRVLISIPLVLILLIIIFQREIREFIKNMRFLKTPVFEVSAHEQKTETFETEEKIKEIRVEQGITLTEAEAEQLKNTIEETVSNSVEKDEKIKNLVSLADYFEMKAEMYEFFYLMYFLVPNSKIALMWFYNKNRTTKELFLNEFPLSPTINDNLVEKESIFEALITNNLISLLDGNDIIISTKGVKFLKFSGLLKVN